MEDSNEKSVLNCVGLGLIDLRYRRTPATAQMPSRCFGILRSQSRFAALQQPHSSTQSIACIGSLTYAEPHQETPWMVRCNGVSIEVDSVPNSEPSMKPEKDDDYNFPEMEEEEDVQQSAIREWANQLRAKGAEVGVRQSVQAAGREVLGRAREIAVTARSAGALVNSPRKIYEFGCSSYTQSGKIVAKMGQITQRCGVIVGNFFGLTEPSKAED